MVSQLSIDEFLEQLASKASTPGGGSAAGLMGAMGAALVSMVCNLTVGKPQYVSVEADMQALLERAEALRAALAKSIADDVAAFDQVMAAYGLPKATDDDKASRTSAIQAALRVAMAAPMAAARLAAEVIELSAEAAEKGNTNVVSDAGVAALAALASLKSAALNVYVNAGALKDRAHAEAQVAELEALLASGEVRAAEVYAAVRARL